MKHEILGGDTNTLLKCGMIYYADFPESQEGNKVEICVKQFKNDHRKLIHYTNN